MPHDIDTADGMANDTTVDDLLRVLNNHRRRCVLRTLQHNPEPTSLDELASRIARWEENGHEATDEARRAVRASLHHVHLPLLVEHDLVRYDAECGVVSAGPRSKPIDDSLSDAHRFIGMLRGEDEANAA